MSIVSNPELFDLIEKVLQERGVSKKSTTTRDLMLQAFEITEELRPGTGLANTDLRKIWRKAGGSGTDTTVSKFLRELVEDGLIEFIGKEPRPNIFGAMNATPVYRLKQE